MLDNYTTLRIVTQLASAWHNGLNAYYRLNTDKKQFAVIGMNSHFNVKNGLKVALNSRFNTKLAINSRYAIGGYHG